MFQTKTLPQLTKSCITNIHIFWISRCRESRYTLQRGQWKKFINANFLKFSLY